MVSLSLRHPFRSVRLLVSNRQWMMGYASGWVGWGIYIAALSLAPLSLVQAVSAGGVGVLAFLAHRLGTPLGRREQVGAWVAVGGLVLLGASLTVGVHHAHTARTSTLLIVIAVGVALAGLLAGSMARSRRPAASLGCAAGLLFGVGDLATKAAVGGNGLFFVPVLAVCTALGFVALQLSFQRGRVLETAGVSTLVNNLIPIVGGLVLFHENLPSGVAGAARVASFAAVVVGAVLLARAPEAPVGDPVDQRPPRLIDGTSRP
jgi:drug/metabolite transporter (DMT)-like permease